LAAPLSGWKQKIVVFAGTLGAPGLFLISFLDSSVLTFPVINDLLLIETLHPTSPAHAALRRDGRAWLAAGLLAALFPGKKGRGSVFSSKKRAAARTPSGTGWRKMDLEGCCSPPCCHHPRPSRFLYFAAGVFEVHW